MSSEDPIKPPVIQQAPPVMYDQPPVHSGGFNRAAGTLGTGAIILAKFSKVLLTLGTMMLSMVIYAQLWGWQFAAGFVICILIHEMGHVVVAKACGHPVSAPMFIPFMGALIVGRQEKSAWESALIGIGGPLFGAFSAIGCWAIYISTGHALYLGIAYTAFFLNLFNMLPIFPLDGGRIVGGVHPLLWLLGIVGLVIGFITGAIRNPFILILVLLSADRIWTGLRTNSIDVGYAERTTTQQRWIMGVAYVSLTGLLAWGMGQTHLTVDAIKERHRMSQYHSSTTPKPDPGIASNEE